MTAVILAAGLGSRLRPHTADTPKGLVEVGGVTLLERSLAALRAAGVERTVIVTGHLGGRIERWLGGRFRGMALEYVANPDFASTGSMRSFLRARDAIAGDGDVLLLESDLVYAAAALERLLASPHRDAILVASPLENGDDVRVAADAAGRVTDLGKALPADAPGVAGCLVGISRFSAGFLEALFATAEGDLDGPRRQEHYEEAVLRASRESGIPVHAVAAPGLAWTEIDDADDLRRAEAEVLPRLEARRPPAVERRILLNPGPATTTDPVKLAQVVPDVCPREREFGDLMAGIADDLCRLALPAGGHEEYAAVLLGGSGTAAVEAVLASAVPPGGRLLVVENGAYGRRMLDIAAAYGIDAVALRSPADRAADPAALDAALAADASIAVVAAVHHETTSGVLNPAEAMGEAVARHGRVFVLDAMSSFAGLPLDLRGARVDFMVSSSNKCLQGMAGVGFAVCRRDRLEAIAGYPRRAFYLSLFDQHAHLERERQTRFTPPVQTLYALRRAIDELWEEGLEGRRRRYAANGAALRAGAEALGLRVVTRPEEESGLLFSLAYPDDPAFDFDRLHDALYARGFTIYPGKLGGADTFRLAGIGAIDPRDVHDFLRALGEELGEEMEEC